MQGFLRRYTELPFLIHFLKTKQLTLLDPDSWDDTNDSFLVEEYRKRKKLKSVLALCFAEAPETYHHWRVFSGDIAGVCIVFHKGKLRAWTKNNPGLKFGKIDYITLQSFDEKNLNVDNLPFIKRYPFIDEKEYRILYEDSDTSYTVKDFDIDLTVIKKIIIGPWLPKPA